MENMGFELPNPRLEMATEKTSEELNNLLYFNTVRFWHCYYDKRNKCLYNEYGKMVLDNARDYLIEIGCLSEDDTELKYFEDEPSCAK